MLPKSKVIELEMTVDEALKYIISMGVVVPEGHTLVPGRDPAGQARAQA
jgi:uncharacterized membrane protein